MSIDKSASFPFLEMKKGPSTWNGNPVRTQEFCNEKGMNHEGEQQGGSS